MTIRLTIALAAWMVIVAGNGRAASSISSRHNDGNDKVVEAILGRIPLTAGDRWALDLNGDHLVNYAIDDATAAGMAASGKTIVELTPAESRDFATRTMNLEGFASAAGIHADGAAIVLDAASGGD